MSTLSKLSGTGVVAYVLSELPEVKKISVFSLKGVRLLGKSSGLVHSSTGVGVP